MKSLFPTGLILLLLSSSSLAQDLSEFGVKVEGATGSATRALKGDWTPAVCAEIQRMEKMVTEDARPSDRPLLRIGLLFLQQKHCGIDISAKLAADQKILEQDEARAKQSYQENMEAASRAASSPAPAPSLHCITRRLPSGAVSTDCE